MTVREVLYAASNMKHIRDFHLPYIGALRANGDRVTVLAHDAGADVDMTMAKSVLSPSNLRGIANSVRYRI